MKHAEIGTLRAYLDGQLDSRNLAAVEQHVKSCAVCERELGTLRDHAARVRDGLDRLPELPGVDNSAMAWAAFQKKREDWMEREQNWWSWGRRLSLAGAGLGLVAVVLVLTVAPVRAWAESLLGIFRVERFTILEIDPSALKGNGLQNNQLLNQAISRVLSDEVTVTQKPQKPQPVADAATASKAAGFPVQLLPGETPSGLLVESGAGMQMKLNRDRIQSILDEAGRSDLQIPASVDGATVGVRVPAGVMAFYGNCGNAKSGMVFYTSDGGRKAEKEADASCISLIELPSPVVSAPQEIDPAQIAQVALQFMGMSANDAANFTQTVDWTSTLVLPVERGKTKYEQVHVNGNEAALIRPLNQGPSGHYSLMWVDNGIVYGLGGTGDDTTAINLASQLQ
jgi:anti-sigma factor RsiW